MAQGSVQTQEYDTIPLQGNGNTPLPTASSPTTTVAESDTDATGSTHAQPPGHSSSNNRTPTHPTNQRQPPPNLPIGASPQQHHTGNTPLIAFTPAAGNGFHNSFPQSGPAPNSLDQAQVSTPPPPSYTQTIVEESRDPLVTGSAAGGRGANVAASSNTDTGELYSTNRIARLAGEVDLQSGSNTIVKQI